VVKRIDATFVVLMAIVVAGCGSPEQEVAAEEPPAAANGVNGERVHVSLDSDAQAIKIAKTVMERMGGWDSWDDTHYLSWDFFGGRRHYWDRSSGDIRIEAERDDDRYLWLMNANSVEGRVWKNGEEVTDADALDELLTRGHQIWVNDSYWLVMPYKLLDPGVTLKYAGERPLEDGRAADVLELTFAEDVGYTPQNRYEVFVARDTGLVEQWSFYREATDAEPGFTMPWENWQPFGDILLATGRGEGKDWNIAVHDQLATAIFSSPDPVTD
jgi:hypothetical protein